MNLAYISPAPLTSNLTVPTFILVVVPFSTLVKNASLVIGVVSPAGIFTPSPSLIDAVSPFSTYEVPPSPFTGT